jgi:hypothetical protein
MTRHRPRLALDRLPLRTIEHGQVILLVMGALLTLVCVVSPHAAARNRGPTPTSAQKELVGFRSSMGATSASFDSPSTAMAILLAALDEREQAFASLEKAYEAHDLQLQSGRERGGVDPLCSDPLPGPPAPGRPRELKSTGGQDYAHGKKFLVTVAERDIRHRPRARRRCSSRSMTRL